MSRQVLVWEAGVTRGPLSDLGLATCFMLVATLLFPV